VHPQQLTERVYLLQGASNVGLVAGEGREALLIDTGIGRRSGQQIERILQAQGLRLTAILNTHCHGDHTGGNAYLVERSGATVYAPRYDSVVIEEPIWGTMFLFGGGEPIEELRVPRFDSAPCRVDVIVSEGAIEIAGLTVQVVPLPGHTGTHTGYVVDGVFFTGDIVEGDDELENAPLSYTFSVGQRLDSLERLRNYSCSHFVLGHGGVQTRIGHLLERNIAQVKHNLEFITGYLAHTGAEAAEVLSATCKHHGIAARNVRQYFLMYPTICSYLSYLHQQGTVAYEFRDNRLLWHTQGSK